MSAAPTPTGWTAFRKMIWQENPVFVQILGICSALAVTNLVYNTLIMCLGLIFTTSLSCLTVSLLREATPRRVRMMTQVLIIAAYVILVQICLDAYLPDISKQLGPYVGLIITNCIVMGRCEAFAAGNRPLPAFCDGLGAGCGYSLVLLAVALVREPLGMGTLLKGSPLELTVLPEGWTHWNLMIIAPSGFFCLAGFIALARTINAAQAKKGRS